MVYRVKYPSGIFGLSDALCSFMDLHPDFVAGLKLNNSKRFQLCPVIITSTLPKGHLLSSDEVIGLWYWDSTCRLIKQDFVINKNFAHKDFVAYASESIAVTGGELVKPIKEFFKKYGNNGTYYHRDHPSKPWMHHYESLDMIPEPIRPWAQKYLKER